jgi:hypothetical protein
MRRVFIEEFVTTLVNQPVPWLSVVVGFRRWYHSFVGLVVGWWWF